jgi:hypothetical protein
VTVGEEEGSLVCLNGLMQEAEAVLEMQTDNGDPMAGGDGKYVVFYVVIAIFNLQKESDIVNVGMFFTFYVFLTT